jgi:creatinine amidohydrolase
MFIEINIAGTGCHRQAIQGATVSARPFILHEANLKLLREYRPNVAVLPWGATEAHNLHLPHGTDVIEATALAERAGQIAHEAGAKALVLPTIPFGNNEQQLDQVATISFRTSTALAILGDVARSLSSQEIDRLVVLNAHGGNEFKPIVRDVQKETGMLIVVVNFFQMRSDALKEIFEEPDDHAGEMETSLILHLRPDWVAMAQAGEGRRLPFAIEGLTQAGVWTPRPWSAVHPDTGSGNPRKASAQKGAKYFEVIARSIAELLVALSRAQKGQVPYL